jgi:putative membrane protein insertion efficiency factor
VVFPEMRKIAVGPIRMYRRLVSPMLPPSCRYWPTCSEYALQAIQKHGVVKGGLLGAWRIIRCNPWSKGGIDPVR